MKSLFLILACLSISAAGAQTFHVTTGRDLQPTDPAPISRAFKVYVIEGALHGSKYTTMQTFSWGSQRFTVGTDYVVAKEDARTLTVVTHDKKGRDVKELLQVVSVSEGPSK